MTNQQAEKAIKVWIDGAVRDAADASVSVLDHGLLYGDGVFEGIRALDGFVLDLEQHLQRLRRSARAIYLEIPPPEELRRMVLETLGALGAPSAYVRLVVTRGIGQLGIDTRGCVPKAFCIAGQIRLYHTPPGGGLALRTVSLRRPAADSLDPSVKSLNYLNNVLCKRQAQLAGADEALVLNQRGQVAEASGANLWLRNGHTLVTPRIADGALPGITRRRVLSLAERCGLSAREDTLSVADVLDADEVFLSGTGAGLVPVASLDGQPLSGIDERVLPQLQAETVRYAKEHGTPISLPAARAAG